MKLELDLNNGGYEMNFKVGDKVKIREDLAVGVGSNGTKAVDEMLKYRGKTATIVELTFMDNYHLDVDDETYERWAWNDGMLEPVSSDSKTQPSYYGKFDLISAVQYGLLDQDTGFAASIKFNAMKYIIRAEHKDDTYTDIDKAIEYLNRLKEGI